MPVVVRLIRSTSPLDAASACAVYWVVAAVVICGNPRSANTGVCAGASLGAYARKAIARSIQTICCLVIAYGYGHESISHYERCVVLCVVCTNLITNSSLVSAPFLYPQTLICLEHARKSNKFCQCSAGIIRHGLAGAASKLDSRDHMSLIQIHSSTGLATKEVEAGEGLVLSCMVK